MKRKFIKILAIGIMAAVLIITFSPVITQATHGFGSGRGAFIVDGNISAPFIFEGYFGDGPVPAIRLADLAYMLNGTPAQFSIHPSQDERAAFWIKRGQSYTPTGAEFQPMPEYRWAAFGSYGFISWGDSLWFDGYPIRSIIIGVDGNEAPETFAAISVIQDIDDIFFSVMDLQYLLGFVFTWNPFHHEDERSEYLQRYLHEEHNIGMVMEFSPVMPISMIFLIYSLTIFSHIIRNLIM